MFLAFLMIMTLSRVMAQSAPSAPPEAGGDNGANLNAVACLGTILATLFVGAMLS
ncbi:hypothetical protein KP509_21G067200 [Ceratopteris richardii]|nr:hypothetical protein KP509_21G067200 [Ceratopteris richardii]